MTAKPTPSESALALIDYPSRFPLKVFGKKSTGFESIVVALLKSCCPADEHIEISRRDSKKGNYTALTLTFTAYSQKQIEEVYQDLYDCEQVVMSL